MYKHFEFRNRLVVDRPCVCMLYLMFSVRYSAIIVDGLKVFSPSVSFLVDEPRLIH